MPEEIETQLEETTEEQPKVNLFDKIKIHKFKILAGVLGVFIFAGAVFGAYKLGQRQAQFAPQPSPTPIVTPTPEAVVPPEEAFICVEKVSLNCAEEIELSFQCTEEYQSWAEKNCPGWEEIPLGERVSCKEPRPQFCTMECIVNPPYICGSDGKSYCSECQACANTKVEWYVTRDEPCGSEEATFVCPEPGILDCMPGGWRPELKYCTSEYSSWIKKNCPRVSIVW